MPQEAKPIPREAVPDSTLSLVRDPYRFIGRRCAAHGRDIFQTRILLRKTICLSGARAAELYYDPELFRRHGAMPGRIQKTLLGQGGVQSLDGEAHLHRKAMLLSLLQMERLNELSDRVDEQWQESARRWAGASGAPGASGVSGVSGGGSVVLYDGVRELICRALCGWAGVPLGADEVSERTRQLTDLYERAGAVGPRHWWGRVQRKRANRWIGGLVDRVRRGELDGAEGTPLQVVATHRDMQGRLLDRHVAAVEVLNLLRPAVAVSVYIAFIAHALHTHPEWRDRLSRDGDGEAVDYFVQEVRRFYPFFPSVAATTRRAFEWDGYRFPADTRAMLDLFGTNRDGRVWSDPDIFDPDRFRETPITPFNLIPQGGGEHEQHHRCAGEWVTLELMRRAARFLSRLEYDVPEQDLRVDEGRLPARPRSGFVMERVRWPGA